MRDPCQHHKPISDQSHDERNAFQTRKKEKKVGWGELHALSPRMQMGGHRTGAGTPKLWGHWRERLEQASGPVTEQGCGDPCCFQSGPSVAAGAALKHEPGQFLSHNITNLRIPSLHPLTYEYVLARCSLGFMSGNREISRSIIKDFALLIP
jgi:hypothetical protein